MADTCDYELIFVGDALLSNIGEGIFPDTYTPTYFGFPHLLLQNELLYFSIHPRFGCSDKGISFSTGLLFSSYVDEMTRSSNQREKD